MLLGLIPRSDEYKRNIKEQEKLLTESLDSKFDDDNKALKEYSTLRYKTEKETIHITLLSCVFSIVFLVKPEEYFNVTISICLLHSIFIIASTITMFKREDGKGLHDLLCRTSVINE